MGCCSFCFAWILWSRKEERIPRSPNAPVGAFLGAGHGLFESALLLYQEQHLMGCCSFVLHGFFMEEERGLNRNAPVGNVSRARGTGCSNPLFYCTKSSTLWGAALFLFCMDLWRNAPGGEKRARHGLFELLFFVRNAPVGASRFCAGNGLFESALWGTKSSTLWGALFVLHGFMEQGAEPGLAPKNPVGRF